MNSEEKTFDYKEAYEQERLRSAELSERVNLLETQNAELDGKLKQIHNSFFWKVMTPLKKFRHLCLRTFRRLKNCGSPKGVIRKLRAKKRDKKAVLRLGTASFPTAERIALERATVFENPVKISILVPLYNTPSSFLREMVHSVTNQTYENWELCLADGSDDAHADVKKIVEELIAEDRGASNYENRILYKKLLKNEGISGNTNECLTMATGEYIGLFDHDDVLHPSALFEYVKAINERGADYLYCDEATFKSGNLNKIITLHFKPDYAVDNLRANNYICHFSVFKRSLLEGTELFRKQFDGSQDHDMILRLTDQAKCVVHIPRILYYWRSHPGSVASDISAKPYAVEAAKGAVADHLRRHGYKNFEITSTKAYATIFRIRYEVEASPKISILIPNKDHIEDLKRCISSIRDRSTYTNYEILVIENGSKEEATFAYYEQLNAVPEVRVLTYTPAAGEGFNYSKINNFGAKQATGEYILLLNNDTKVITPTWLEEMLMYAQRKDVACVGAKLYYEDNTIQHAGVIIGLGAHRSAGHCHYRVNKENLGYMGRLCYAQDLCAVTGACLMVRKALYEELGGLDETLAIALNDVDFCLRAREKGYLNVFTPFAELYHFESKSRGAEETPEKAERYNKECAQFKERHKALIEAGDPYFNPNFSLDDALFALKA